MDHSLPPLVINTDPLVNNSIVPLPAGGELANFVHVAASISRRSSCSINNRLPRPALRGACRPVVAMKTGYLPQITPGIRRMKPPSHRDLR